ncbi:hypothetical protein VNI00_018452 [Paramarasmius palmivorus]|uniref:Uncharacterized protein n=1 Tax=Paramarasmius palmivorus TaxID=297713 RepID=A0AAW0AWR5_9AGAR
MQFKTFSTLVAVVLPAIVGATPVPGGGGSASICSSGGVAHCCNGGIASCVLSDSCNTADVYCCFNDNTQIGAVNENKGNCQQANIGSSDSEAEGGGANIVSGLLGGLLGGLVRK